MASFCAPVDYNYSRGRLDRSMREMLVTTSYIAHVVLLFDAGRDRFGNIGNSESGYNSTHLAAVEQSDFRSKDLYLKQWKICAFYCLPLLEKKPSSQPRRPQGQDHISDRHNCKRDCIANTTHPLTRLYHFDPVRIALHHLSSQ